MKNYASYYIPEMRVNKFGIWVLGVELFGILLRKNKGRIFEVKGDDILFKKEILCTCLGSSFLNEVKLLI